MNIPENKILILFDGVCNLCNSTVTKIIKRDKNNVFVFAPLQSYIGNEIVTKFNIDTRRTDSIILYNPIEGKVHSKSTAALKIASKLGFPMNLWCATYIIPAFMRNYVYDFIAKNRYKWYGKRESCMIPTPELQAKFIA